MEEQKLAEAFELIGENIDIIMDNEKRIVLLLEKLARENEELKKHQWIMAQIITKLKQEIDNLK